MNDTGNTKTKKAALGFKASTIMNSASEAVNRKASMRNILEYTEMKPTTLKNILSVPPTFVCRMRSPRLRVTICKALDLPKVSIFGSPPSTFVRLSVVQEMKSVSENNSQSAKQQSKKLLSRIPSKKAAFVATPVNQTELVTDATSPEYDESFEINIESSTSQFSHLSHIEKIRLFSGNQASSVQFSDFVTIRLEIFEASSSGGKSSDEKFLGMIQVHMKEKSYFDVVCIFTLDFILYS